MNKIKIEEINNYSEKCLHEELPSCTYACPLHLDIRAFMDKVQKGNWNAAYRILRNTLIFPRIVSELCDAPCRNHCIRKFSDKAVAVSDIEKACLNYAVNKEAEKYNMPLKTQRVAIVGAGLSGLACALRLAVKKYQVTVYDKEDGYGGILRKHPQAEYFLEEIEQQLRNEKIEFKFGVSINTLLDLDYDAVYIATGKNSAGFGLLDSLDRDSLSTKERGIFLGGMITGAEIIEAIEQGSRASKIIEAFLKTGEINLPLTGHYSEANRDRYIPIKNLEEKPEIVMSSKSGYAAEEAVEESRRCLKCECTICRQGCEMLMHFKKNPKQISNEIYLGSMAVKQYTSRTATRLISSCNICGYCKAVCPKEVDIGDLSLYGRQDMEKNQALPPAFHDFWMKEMEYCLSGWEVILPPPGQKTCSYLFFPGCQLGSSCQEYVENSYLQIKHLRGGVGLMLSCCGAPAYWAGKTDRHKEIIDHLKSAWQQLGKPILIFACATCKKLWQEFIKEAESTSLYEIINKNFITERNNDFIEEAVLFDPCSARYDSGMRESVRDLLRKTGIGWSELEDNGEIAKCCGWGGHIQAANPHLYNTIVNKRISASEKPYITYCANCHDTFAREGKKSIHILDAVFCMDNGSRKVPTIKERRQNLLLLKKVLLKSVWDMDFEPFEKEYDAFELKIEPTVQIAMERELISEDIIRKAIWKAENGGMKISSRQSGRSICNLEEDVVTYWAEYAKEGQNQYVLYKAYSHRMKINK